jgi:hypothetical protein
MPRTCSICRHDERRDIEVALVKREPYRHIAARFSVSTGALQRHTQDHLPDRLLKSQERQEVQEALDVVGQLRTINETSLAILEEARDVGDPSTALRAADRVLKQLDFKAKLLGQLDERPQTNLYLSSEWLNLRALIIGALEPYREAREAVVAALEGAEDDDKP